MLANKSNPATKQATVYKQKGRTRPHLNDNSSIKKVISKK
jgi:hypothetical protein